VAWRFGVALCGTLSILMLARIARRLLGSTLLGCTAGLLLAVDGQHFVHSRTALLDLFLMFWVLAGFGCLLIDRDRARAALDRHLAAGNTPTWRHLPRTWWIRPWRMTAGLCFGLATGVKWSGIFFLAGYALASLLWDLATLRRHDIATPAVNLIPQGSVAFLTTIPAALAAYLATWTGWFATRDGYHRQWSTDNPGLPGWLPDTAASHALRSLWQYHKDAWNFHVGVTSPHPWEANPWSWIVQGRPTMFWLDNAVKGCGSSSCTEASVNLGTPTIWWGGTVAVAVLLFCWALRRDWRAGAILAGLAAGYLPWFHYQERTIFGFYAIAFTPWLVLAVSYTLGLVLGPRDASPDRQFRGAVWAGGFVALAVACFAWFHPVLAAEIITRDEWGLRMWLPSWI